MNINKLIEGQRENEIKLRQIITSAEVEAMQKEEPVDRESIARQYSKYFLIKFLDSEIERLIILRTENDTKSDDFALGIDKVLTDQITHLQDIKKQLE